ncbi:glycosyl hydrolase family 65 protein [Streptomyces iconiensis]|uniref:glycosyl hydrolase family 65 protein n=1 Tax=Streptomyces iconiensis TaxID=1384038 RepID=UPI003D2F6045
MAGTLDLVQRGLPGLEIREGTLHRDPAPLPQLCEYGFSVRFREYRGIGMRVTADTLDVSLPVTASAPLRFGLHERTVTVAPGETAHLVLPR